MSSSPHRGPSTTQTPPELLHRMFQHLRMHHRSGPQTKQEQLSTSVATSHPAPTPTESIDQLKGLETLLKENQVVKADLFAKDNELSQCRKELQELKIQFEAFKAEAQKEKEQLILYNESQESMEKAMAQMIKENQELNDQLGLLCDEHQVELGKAMKEAERMRQKHDRFLALLAKLCYNEHRRTLLRSTFLSMNVLVGLDEDELEELFHFINLDDSVTSNVAANTN